MMRKTMTSLAVAAACLGAAATLPTARAQLAAPPTEVITNGPQTDLGDNGGRSAAQQNVRESGQYESLVHSNPGFRAARIQKECGPITDPQLHANCVASFGANEGSSMAPADDRENRNDYRDDQNR